MDGPSTPRSQRSNRQMPTPSSGVNPPSSSAANPYVVPSDFRGRDAAAIPTEVEEIQLPLQYQ